MIKKYVLLILSLATISIHAISIDEIVKKTEDAMQGDTLYMKMEMRITTPKHERRIELENWSEHQDKSFIKILYPTRDKGTTFLKINSEIWQYIPRIERTIKIPPSMMTQSWMGSDFTNDDLVKESSLHKDFFITILEETPTQYVLELIPKPEAAVTWGKIVYVVESTHFLPIREDFYDEEGVLVRQMVFEDVRKINDRFFPFLWKVIPTTADKEGHVTTIVIHEAIFNEAISSSLFTRRALKTQSK